MKGTGEDYKRKERKCVSHEVDKRKIRYVVGTVIFDGLYINC